MKSIGCLEICSLYFLCRLFDYIAVALMSRGKLQRLIEGLHSDFPVKLLTQYKHVNDYRNEDLQSSNRQNLLQFAEDIILKTKSSERYLSELFAKAFTFLDQNICDNALPSNGIVDYDNLSVGISGACATVAHIDGVHLHIANTGDCRAVLGQQNMNGNIEAKPLTQVHAYENVKEVDRVYSEHPRSERVSVIRGYRLLGSLAPFRAFGDVAFKWTLKQQNDVVQCLPSEYRKYFMPRVSTVHVIVYLLGRGQKRCGRVIKFSKFFNLEFNWG